MRWFKIHVGALLIILAGWCLYDSVLKNESGWIVAMSFIIMINIINLREAITNDH